MPATRLLTHAELTAKLAPPLFKASHLCVRRPSLAPLYAAPSGTWPAGQAKFFKLEIGGRQETAGVDRSLRLSVDGLRRPDRVAASDAQRMEACVLVLGGGGGGQAQPTI
jgi:hypothetical protein